MAEINWRRIERFVGFGRDDARVIFVGMEERLDPKTDIIRELQLRSTYSEMMDLLDAFGPTATEADLAVNAPTWRVMCDLMLRREGESPTLDLRKRYQRTRLGRSDGQTLLCELLPFANVDRNSWAYAGISPYLNRAEYEKAVMEPRKTLLRNTIAACDRELIVCYGKGDWCHYRDLFPATTWRTSTVFELATIGKARILLSPHFGRWFAAEERLQELASVALSE